MECARRRSYVLEGFPGYFLLFLFFSRFYVAIKCSSELDRTCTVGSM